MQDSERYADSRTQINVDGQLVYAKWCARQRCMHRIVLQRDIENDTDRQWRYPHYTVIVSLEDGTQKKAYCSIDCATIVLTSMRKAAKKASE